MKKAVMYGAGSIGRGFIGQLFYISGYETCFIDVNQEIIDLLNNEHQYTLTIASPNGYKSEYIRNIHAISGNDTDKAASEIAECEIMATAVGENILKFIAPVIAKGIDQRKTPLNIIVCENMMNSDEYLKSLIRPYIKNMDFFENNIGFIQASVGRMVPVVVSNNPLEVIVEQYNQLQIDKDKIVGTFPEIKNILQYSPFESMKKRKLYMHNMSHAVCAYLGKIKGYEYIYQAIEDKAIQDIVRGALLESANAISKSYGVSLDELIAHGEDLIERYHNKYLRDTIERVGRDPKRKLKRDDRLIGAALFCLSNEINPEYILIGIKAALSYEKELSMTDTQLKETEPLYEMIIKASLPALNT
ncbi:MAG: mannitol dehydrogenase [Clostridia bacterium]|nr:mannitol dehydrogenase [Clostridia bacterium]